VTGPADQRPAPGWADRAAELDRRIAEALEARPDWYPSKVRARLVETPQGCLEWTGSRNPRGYGWVRLPGNGPPVAVHRVVYLTQCGEIGYGLSLDHLCRTRACANPDHLEPVTHRTNVMRGTGLTAANSRRTHCPSGHPLSPGNLAADDARRGHRSCLTCERQQSAEQSAARSAAARHLGLARDAYVARYGHSRRVADAILAGADPAAFALPHDPARQAAADRQREADRQRAAGRDAACSAAARRLGLTWRAYRLAYGNSRRVAEAILAGDPAADPGEAA
jgi:hypothetical protein